MEIRCAQNKLENTIIDLNNQGYTVMSSSLDGAEYILQVKKVYILQAKKVHLKALKSLSDPILEDSEKKEFRPRNRNMHSIFRGMNFRWKNRL